MILVNRDHESEVRDKLIRHAIGLMQKYDNVSVAFLCPSNKGVNEFSNFLKNSGVEHFKVGSNDLFSKVEALDFIAFLSALYNPKSRLAWSRLFYRFGDLSRLSSGDRDNYSPLLASADLAAKLGRLGSELKDFLYGDVEQHYLVQFVAHAKGKVTYFDTETTGLSYNQDAIIQLAGVKVDNGSVNEEIDLYCRTDIPLGDSVKVHHITEKVLDKYGQSIDQQLNRFLEFNNLRPLVAHNLPFDDNMLRSHLKKFLPLSYATYEALPKYCTLDLARRFYPSLSNHKLGCLLEYFELDGVNSHNAIDDVKAGSALMTKLVDDAESKLPEITQLIEPYTDALQRFSDRFSPLYNEATSMINEEKVVSIKELLDLYFSYTEELPGAKYDKVSLTEFSQKIIRHADENFKPAHFRNYLDQVMPFYQTAKEPDLITKSDRLVVSTIHRSKGLEFDCVLIPSAIEDVLPSFFVKKQLDSLPSELRNEANSLLQEQARLFYVAFTRAKRQVVVGSYNTQKGYSKSLTRFMSPILKYFRNL